MEHGLSKTRLYSIYSGMKRTSNQKVVTAAIQNRPSKALSAPYQACTALPDRNTAYAVTIQNRGVVRVLGNGSWNHLIEKWDNRRNVCFVLALCCRICYIKHRKRESHRSGSTP